MYPSRSAKPSEENDNSQLISNIAGAVTSSSDFQILLWTLKNTNLNGWFKICPNNNAVSALA